MPPVVQRLGVSLAPLLTIAVLVATVLGANYVAREFAAALDLELRPSNEDLVHRVLMTASVMYAILIAVPFVPAVEIALSMIAVFGPPVVLLVYVCTLVGLSLSYFAGRLIPCRTLSRLLHELHLRRAGDLVARLEPMDTAARLAFLVESSPTRIVPLLLRHRYLALAVALNVPGNFLIGGGGGIALTAGVSRLFSPVGFLLTIALAMSPVPLAVLIFGRQVLGG